MVRLISEKMNGDMVDICYTPQPVGQGGGAHIEAVNFADLNTSILVGHYQVMAFRFGQGWEFASAVRGDE